MTNTITTNASFKAQDLGSIKIVDNVYLSDITGAELTRVIYWLERNMLIIRDVSLYTKVDKSDWLFDDIDILQYAMDMNRALERQAPMVLVSRALGSVDITNKYYDFTNTF